MPSQQRVSEKDLIEIETAWQNEGQFDAAYWLTDLLAEMRRMRHQVQLAEVCMDEFRKSLGE